MKFFSLNSRVQVLITILFMAISGISAVVISDDKTDSAHTELNGPWENMGTDIRQVCDAAYVLEYEWGVTYNNSSPVLRVTCNGWNSGSRVTSYPPYPTGDTEPFTWGGVCWIWGTASTLDDACSIAYHGYYYQDGLGKLYMTNGNGCNALPTVWRRKL